MLLLIHAARVAMYQYQPLLQLIASAYVTIINGMLKRCMHYKNACRHVHAHAQTVEMHVRTRKDRTAPPCFSFSIPFLFCNAIYILKVFTTTISYLLCTEQRRHDHTQSETGMVSYLKSGCKAMRN